MKRLSIIAPVVFLTVSLLGAALVRLAARKRSLELHVEATRIAQASARSIEQRLGIALAKADAVSSEISQRGDLRAFREIAAHRAGATNLWLLVDGRIVDSCIHDGADLFSAGWDETQNGSFKAVGYVPSLELMRTEDGQWTGLLRVPIVFGNSTGTGRFAGWLLAALPIRQLLEAAGLNQLSDSGYGYQLSFIGSAHSPSTILSGNTESALRSPVVETIHASGNLWNLTVAPQNGWYPWQPILLHAVLVFIFALLGAIAGHDAAQTSADLHSRLETREERLVNVNRLLVEEKQQRMELEKQFSHASLHDVFTGMPNRRYFIDRLDRALRRSRRQPKYVVAVIILEFDRLKAITETLGQEAGDHLLLEAVRRFEGCLRPSDLIAARLTGDELGFLLFDIGSAESAAAAADRMQRSLADSFSLNGETVFTTASMGIALSTSGYDDPEELMRRAYSALSKAKAEGHARHEFFDPAARDQVVSLYQLENDLRQAIERKELRLNFQPIVSLRSGRMVGMEVLLRWHHPLEGLVPTDRFIRLAEESGLIVSMTRWVLREACMQAVSWRAKLPSNVKLYLSVNLSGQDLKRGDLCDFVAGVLQETGLPPGILRLEVTEGIMIGNVQSASEVVSRLRSIGVPLLLDDFGTGYSSLSYLHRFKFDGLKIDRAFVNRLTTGQESSGIVRAIVHLAKDLGIKTIAEGVETAEIMNELAALGCDYGQGYYFSKPIEAGAAEALLLSQPNWAGAKESDFVSIHS